MNLAEWPIALIADRAPGGQKTIYFEGGNGRRVTVTGSDAFGLPTAVDTDVLIALIHLTKQRNDFQQVKVHFSRYELIKLLNWPDESFYYNRLNEAFNRWAGVLLVYDKSWWNNRLKRHTDMKMQILGNVEIIRGGGKSGHPDGRDGLPLSSFEWNKKFIDSCQADNLRQLDLDRYFSLKTPVAKRLYRFLGKRFHARGEHRFDLHEIAFERIGLSRNYRHNAAKIREKLQPGIDELEAIGFLRPLDQEERYKRIDRGRWEIRLIRGSHAKILMPPGDDTSGEESGDAVTSSGPADIPRADNQQMASPTAEAEPPALVAELAKRGVTAKTAAELVVRYPPRRSSRRLSCWIGD